jgi:endonuclease YncB( thermonuclease family)
LATSCLVSAPSAQAASSSSSSSSVALPRRTPSSRSFLNLSSLLPKFQFDTVNDVPKSYFTDQRTIYAYVERIIDGDTIRVRHVPFYSWTGRSPQPLTTRGIADQTLSIRIYGVDCPEIAKNGKAGQPFAEEAKQFASNLMLNRMVKITFLRRDQYGRAVSAVETVSPWWALGFGVKDLSLELASAGLGELYVGGGAEYYVSAE